MSKKPARGFADAKPLAEKLSQAHRNQRGTDATLPLEKIHRRAEDTRPLNAEHVVSLAETIAALGLIEPLAVDRRGRLLAGGHRLAAIELLRIADDETRVARLRELVAGVAAGADAGADVAAVKIPAEVLDRARHLLRGQQADDATGGGSTTATSAANCFERHFPGGLVPVREMDFDAEENPQAALAVEVAENEHRRDYTTAEIRGLVERLKTAGYRMAKGRPRAGQRTLNDALATVIGKSRRTVFRILDDMRGRGETASAEEKALARLRSAVNAWLKLPADETGDADREKLDGMAKRMAKHIAGMMADDAPTLFDN